MMAYWMLDPWTGERGDLQADWIAAVLQNTFCNTKHRHEDYMPWRKRFSSTARPPAELEAKFAQFAALHNARQRNGKGAH